MLREPNNMHVGVDGDLLPIVSRSEYPHWYLPSLAATGAIVRLVSEISGFAASCGLPLYGRT